jgi:hypothetical protein
MRSDSLGTLYSSSWSISSQLTINLKISYQTIKREFIKTIQDPADIKKIVFKFMDSAANEILAIFPTVKTLERYRHEGVIEFLNEAAAQPNVSIRTLTANIHESKDTYPLLTYYFV